MRNDDGARIALLERALADSAVTADKLERAARAARRNSALVAACAVAFCGFAAYAAPSIKAVAANDPNAKIYQRMDAMEKQLQGRIDALELRVRKLEQKPDNVDQPDDEKHASTGNSGGANSGGGNSGAGGGPQNSGGEASSATSSVSQQVFNLIQRVTSLEQRTIVKAPFIVTDRQGHAILAVQENGGANGLRGIRIFNDSGQPLVTLDSSGAGGAIKAIASDADETTSGLIVTREGPQVELWKGGTRQARLWTSDNGDNGLQINDKSGIRGVDLTAESDGGRLTITDKGGNIADLSAAISSKTLGLRFMKGNSLLAAMGIGANGAGAAAIRKADGTQSVSIGDTNGGYVNVYGSGTIAAELQATGDGKGVIAVRNKAGNAVAYLTESSQGEGGNITLADPAGNGIVSAGYSASDQGDVCLDRKQHLYCVGVNLPLSMSK